jgi:hypothetical protein
MMNMMRCLRVLLIPAAWLFACGSYGQTLTERIDYTDEDRAIWNQCMATLTDKKALPAGELAIEAARCFSGKPYLASTLEKEPEQLVVNLRELDCTTFVETVVAMTLTMKEATPSFELFCSHLQQLRYREGVITGYTDRLHYFSDWIFENGRKGLVRDMTPSFGGSPLSLNLSFMSTHPDSYRQLKSHPEWIRVMQEKEREISLRNVYAMIPSARINDHAKEMKNGDIVCFITSIDGLDMTHVGFVYWQGDTLKFIHASSAGKKVMIDERPLQDYALTIKTTRGIMIVRILR